MMSGGVRSSIRYPFTASQWQELEHQALVFKYMVSGMPIPPDLLFTITTTTCLDSSSLSSKFLLQQPQHIGWNHHSFNMGFGRKIDPEPGRCRRTDGKKWRCSKEAYPDSKYCERHMHRGRNRSRKPVELLSPVTTTTSAYSTNIINNNSPINIKTSCSSSSISNNNNNNKSLISHSYNHLMTCAQQQPHFLDYSSTRPPPPAFALSSQENHTNFFLDSHSHSREPIKDHRNNIYRYGMKGESDEHPFFNSQSNSNSSSQLTMGSSVKHNINAYSSDLQSGLKIQKHDHYNYTNCDVVPWSSERDEQPKKVMHHFLDEWSHKDNGSWSNCDDHRTQLSISVPNSLHDFFMTQKW